MGNTKGSVFHTARPLLVLLFALVGASCGDVTNPTGPTPAPPPTPPAPTSTPAPTPALPANLAITAFSVTKLYVDGQFRYAPVVKVRETTGAQGLRVNRVEFHSGGRIANITTNRVVTAGGLMTFDGYEMSNASDLSEIAVTISFVDDSGQAGQATSGASVPPIPPGSPTSALRIVEFTVSGFMEGTSFAYWPKLTLAETSGRDSLTVTRVQFDLLGIGLQGRVPPYLPTWRVPAGGTLKLFHDLSYGEPEFYITGGQKADELRVLLSYVDSEGRAGEVSAVAPVVR